MDNIEYYGIPYVDDAELKNYRVTQRKKAKRLARQFDRNGEALRLAEEYEELQQQEAFAAYRRKRAEQKNNSDRDVVLYHLDKGF